MKSIKDTWLDLSDENPYSQFLLTIFAGVNQLERDLIRMMQREGIEIAKTKGKYNGRPKNSLKRIQECSMRLIYIRKENKRRRYLTHINLGKPF